MFSSSLGKVLRFLGLVDTTSDVQLQAITRRREELSGFTEDQLKSAARAMLAGPDLIETFALTAVIAERILGLRMFDVQILGALALVRGHIVEMQTGEGKTLAAVPAVVWFALNGRGVHVLTANDYLARRDAMWVGGVYEWFGLSVAHVSQTMLRRPTPRRIPL